MSRTRKTSVPRSLSTHRAATRTTSRPPPTRSCPPKVIYCQYKTDWARRTVRGIDEQGRQARAGRHLEDTTQAEPVRPAVRRHKGRQPRANGGSQGPRGPERRNHQPAGLPRRRAGHPRVPDRRIPPDLRDRAQNTSPLTNGIAPDIAGGYPARRRLTASAPPSGRAACLSLRFMVRDRVCEYRHQPGSRLFRRQERPRSA